VVIAAGISLQVTPRTVTNHLKAAGESYRHQLTQEELLSAADDVLQLGESGRRLGHRPVQAALFREAGLRPSRRAVLESLREHDPEAMEARLEDILPRRLYDIFEAMIIWHMDSTHRSFSRTPGRCGHSYYGSSLL
jgi:hypothetical protein